MTEVHSDWLQILPTDSTKSLTHEGLRSHRMYILSTRLHAPPVLCASPLGVPCSPVDGGTTLHRHEIPQRKHKDNSISPYSDGLGEGIEPWTLLGTALGKICAGKIQSLSTWAAVIGLKTDKTLKLFFQEEARVLEQAHP